MTSNNEMRSRLFSHLPRFDYLPDEDRYLFALPEPEYRFNIIGLGMNGQEHLRVTMYEGRASIHGVYDSNPKSVNQARDTFKQISKNDDELVVYSSVEEACFDPAVDGLIIATPNYSHIEVVRKAVSAGKHILLEKPMATCIKDAYEIMSLAENYPGVFQIGLQYRYKSIYAETIHEVLQRRSIGDVKTISMVEHRFPFLDKVKQWNKFERYSGGTLVEKCCHYFDLINLFAQARPVQVYATGSMAVNFLEFEYQGERSDIIDNAIVTIVFANGVRASFNLCMFAPQFYEEIVLCGSEGRLRAYERSDFLPIQQPHTGLEVFQGELRPSRVSIPCYPDHIVASGHNGSTFIEHVNFVDNIAGKPTNAANTRESFWSIVVAAAAERSVKTGEVVQIDNLLHENGLEGVDYASN